MCSHTQCCLDTFAAPVLLLLLLLLLLRLPCCWLLLHEFKQVLESQPALGGMAACSKESAVQLLWCLGVAGALSYELWDALSAPLDTMAQPLEPPLLQRIFEAYCLAVLRNSGPAPCEILMPQLIPAGESFCQAVLQPAAAGREKLLHALQAAGLMQANSQATQLQDGHMVLFDVINPGMLLLLLHVAKTNPTCTTQQWPV